MKNPLGVAGEHKAASYLSKHGYKILEQNFRTRNGEIDIVAIDKSEKVSHKNLPDALRIDAVSVLLGEGEPKIELMKNISG